MVCCGKAAGRHSGSSPVGVPRAAWPPQHSFPPLLLLADQVRSSLKRGKTCSVFLSEGRAGPRDVKPSHPPLCSRVYGDRQDTGQPNPAASGSIHVPPQSTFPPGRCVVLRNEPILPTLTWHQPLHLSSGLGSNRSVPTSREDATELCWVWVRPYTNVQGSQFYALAISLHCPKRFLMNTHIKLT